MVGSSGTGTQTLGWGTARVVCHSYERGVGSTDYRPLSPEVINRISHVRGQSNAFLLISKKGPGGRAIGDAER